LTALLLGAAMASPLLADSSYWRFDADGKVAGNNPTGAAGEVVDSTGNGHSGTFIGTLANSSWSSSTPGAFVYNPLTGTTVNNSLSFFFGTNSQIDAALSSVLATASSTNPFTFETFFRTTTASTGNRQIFEHRADASPGQGPDVFMFGTDNVSIRLSPNTGPQASVNSGASGLSGGAWHHFAVVWNGTSFTSYVDRVQLTTVTPPGGFAWTNAAGPLTVGKFHATFAPNLNDLESSWMDEVRVSQQALAPKQFLRAFSAPSMYYTFDEKSNGTLPTGAAGEVNDSSGAAHHGTFVGTNANSNWSNNVPGFQIYDPLTATYRANTTSFRFGTNSAINVLSSTRLPTANSDNAFTFETFIQIPNAVGQTAQVFEHRALTNESGVELLLPNSNDLALRTTNNDSAQANLSNGSANVGNNLWRHLAVVWNGTTLTAYLDYVQVNQITPTSPLWTEGLASGEMTIGKYISGATNINDLVGYLDEIRLTPAALSPSQFLVAIVPEPSAISLLALSVGAVLRRRRRA